MNFCAARSATSSWNGRPGSRVHYHPSAAHWTAAVLIEALPGRISAAFIRDRIVAPLGLADEVMVGVPEVAQARCAEMYDPGREREHDAAPAGMLARASRRRRARRWRLCDRARHGRFLSGARQRRPARRRPAAVAAYHWIRHPQFYRRSRRHEQRLPATSRAWDHRRAASPRPRAASARSRIRATFGHGGAGSSYCWADPVSGVSFAFLSNARLTNEAHDLRTEVLSNFVHAAISMDVGEGRAVPRQMVLVGFLQAQNCTNLASSWRHPVSRTDFMSADYYQEIGRILEAREIPSRLLRRPPGDAGPLRQRPRARHRARHPLREDGPHRRA